MKPEVARRRIEAFERRFGKTHLIFACHGAFPLALTPDLLYKLWANFQRDIHGKVLGIPWVAVADLLLSSLCDEVGQELYEMDTAVRNSLLNRLKEDDNFGQIRINELSDFLLVYLRQQLQSNDQEVRDFAQAQRWTALAYLRPNEAAQELRLALEQTYQQDKSEQLRLMSLIETFAEPLAEFEPLLVYAREIGNFTRSDKIGTGINMDLDISLIQQLPNTESVFLVESSREQLNAQLWDEQGWDIFYFGGYSSSDSNGKIFLNPTDALTAEELKFSLKKAVERGLKLAIFNSCDGLGIANKLADLGSLTIIVMRELLPEVVAQEFLKHFLIAFSSGQSLYTSIREAREKLKVLENDYPCASWLPVIFQNPAEEPPTWQGFLNTTTDTNKPVRVDYYAQLKKLLEGGNWKEADEETARLMLRVAGREKEGYFDDISQIYKIPGEVLRTIDILWVNYSNARFGLSVQKRIYQSLGGTREYNTKIWEQFGENVGWRRDNKWLLYVYLDFSLNAPEGCYPAQVLRLYETGGVWVVDEFSAVLLSRSELEGELQD